MSSVQVPSLHPTLVELPCPFTQNTNQYLFFNSFRRSRAKRNPKNLPLSYTRTRSIISPTRTSTNSLKPQHYDYDNSPHVSEKFKTLQPEPQYNRHPAFRYSFVPPSPFGAATPIRVPSYRAPEVESTAPMRVRSLRHFLLPQSLIRRSGVDVDGGRLGALMENERVSRMV